MLGSLIFVSGLGEGHQVPGNCTPIQGRIAVIPRPGGSAATLGADILRALGKRRAAGSLTGPDNDATLTARTWLQSSGHKDVFVVNAEWLDDEALRSIRNYLEVTRIWLLFSGDPTLQSERILEPYGPEHASEASFTEWFRKSNKRGEEDWSNFPVVPLDGPFTFRGRCKRLFDAVEMDRIDAALDLGVSRARRLLIAGRPTNEFAELMADPTLPIWPALTALRGMQLGALSMNQFVDVNLGRWMQLRLTRPTLDSKSRAALSEQSDPEDSVLLTLAAVTAASPMDLANLNRENVAADASVISFGSSVRTIPPELQPACRAFMEIRHRATTAEHPLFATKTGRRRSGSQIARQLDQAAMQAATTSSARRRRATSSDSLETLTEEAIGLRFQELTAQ